MAKIYDIAVVTGEYRNTNGETKKRYQNVGAVMEGNDGGQYIMLNAWFNPAGVPRKDGSESVLLSCFVPKDQQQDTPRQSQPQPQQQRQQVNTNKFEEDDIPFN